MPRSRGQVGMDLFAWNRTKKVQLYVPKISWIRGWGQRRKRLVIEKDRSHLTFENEKDNPKHDFRSEEGILSLAQLTRNMQSRQVFWTLDFLSLRSVTLNTVNHFPFSCKPLFFMWNYRLDSSNSSQQVYYRETSIGIWLSVWCQILQPCQIWILQSQVVIPEETRVGYSCN